MFTKNNVRIEVNPENLQRFEGYKNIVINPDLSKVIGVAPHFWKLKKGKVLPMSPTERGARLKTIERIGIQNELVFIPYPKSRLTVKNIMIGLGAMAAAIAAILLLT